MNEANKKISAEVAVEKNQQKSRMIFVFYIVGLFSIALVLILVSYVMQTHANRQIESIGIQLDEQTDAAKGAQARADQLQEAVDTAKAQLEELQKKNDELTGQQTEQQTAVDAMESLILLQKAYYTGDEEEAVRLIEQMDKTYTRAVLEDAQKAPLTGDCAELYASICAGLGY